MSTQKLPTIREYITRTNDLVTSNTLTIEQAIILQTCYRNTLEGKLTNINFLMQVTALSWKQINYILNGLIMKGALTSPEKKWYIVKIAQ